ncbi:hypothetical protein UlMin_025802 [Ulmus minor]
MASNSSSSPYTLSYSFPTLPVSEEDYKQFHSIDRRVFTRLVYSLNRDPLESLRLMALWLWLEVAVKGFMPASQAIILLTDKALEELINESILILKYIEREVFPFAFDSSPHLPTIQRVTRCNYLTLRYFHDHRHVVHRGVGSKMDDVCARAFDDIIEQREMVRNVEMEERAREMMYPSMLYPDHVLSFPPLINLSGGRMGPVGAYLPDFRRGANAPFWPRSHLMEEGGSSSNANISRAENVQREREGLGVAVEEIVESLNLDETEPIDENREEAVVPVEPEDRSIFLTFSRGYPISLKEVTDFFASKFGELVQEIVMQEVEENEQPLYARLVLPSVSDIETVLDGKRKVKFTINGKHVLARKFERRNRSLAEASSSSATRA